jgi:hypothetical protein
VRRLALALLAAAVLPAFSPAPSQDRPTPPPQATCTFTNATYSGKCVETAEILSGSSAQQTCESILRCLNDVGCAKTYCQATTIRSGWRLESAK